MNNHEGYSGTGFVDTTNTEGASITWKVDVDGGNYDVSVRFANGSTARGATLSSNEINTTYSFATTGDWATWADETHTVSLAAGENTIQLSALTAGGLPNVDAITIAGAGVLAADCATEHTGPMLSQAGNPIYTELNNYKSWLSSSGTTAAKLAADKTIADNMITWQMPHGGFYKYGVSKYSSAWNGSDARSDWTGANGVELGTIDNDATVSELLFLADVYKRSGETKYRDAARSALEFLLTMQYSTGGWPQVYPARSGTSYSNHVTFNDNAMARVLILLDKAARLEAPLDGDIFTADQHTRISTAINSGIDFILNAQIIQGDVKTVWCAQHDPYTYEAKPARSYELASKSGKESVLVVAFLMTRPQSEAIENAVKAALAWYRNPNVQVANTEYVKRTNNDDNYNPIQTKAGSTMWYRFYDLDQDVGFFSGRSASDNPAGNGKQYDIMLIEPERRYKYEWGGNYGKKIIDYANSVGY